MGACYLLLGPSIDS
uniref:Uncharacterized protein n=1 Tax=Arundo donax TaxID=35708 RepID=A0A0A9C555_ARUDO